jgi:purine-nucleoside/S-methyl-5'-thioadenosine phosphorylase / adenosine deaminase
VSLPEPGDDFEWRRDDGGLSLLCRSLEPHAIHFFTTREWRLGTPQTDRDAGWLDVARAMDVEAAHLVRAHQVHGASVVIRRRGERPIGSAPLPHADILVSDDPSLALAIQTADCVPVLMADGRTGAVAAAHAGWRGLAARVPAVAVGALADAFDSRAPDLIVAIGPSICAQKYEVDAKVRDAFAVNGATEAELARWFLPGVRPQHWQFDGWRATRDQLEGSGVATQEIHAAGLCSATHPQLCSYRRDGAAAGRMVAAIRARSR